MEDRGLCSILSLKTQQMLGNGPAMGKASLLRHSGSIRKTKELGIQPWGDQLWILGMTSLG